MPIVSSVLVADLAQSDGRRYLRERHTDHLAKIYLVEYLAPAATDAAAAMAARVLVLEDRLVQAEIEADLASIYQLGDAAVVTTNYVSLADARAALREAYRTVTREQALALGAFLNTLTNPQLGTLFGVSGAALTALKTRLTTKASQWAVLVAAVGE
jgi:hypothetical protein